MRPLDDAVVERHIRVVEVLDRLKNRLQPETYGQVIEIIGAADGGPMVDDPPTTSLQRVD